MVKKKAKKKYTRVKRRRRSRPFPPLVKLDLRRIYPIMFANILNSCDVNLIRRFFHRYGVQNVELKQLSCLQGSSRALSTEFGQRLQKLYDTRWIEGIVSTVPLAMTILSIDRSGNQ
jgi:hypothetical protein